MGLCTNARHFQNINWKYKGKPDLLPIRLPNRTPSLPYHKTGWGEVWITAPSRAGVRGVLPSMCLGMRFQGLRWKLHKVLDKSIFMWRNYFATPAFESITTWTDESNNRRRGLIGVSLLPHYKWWISCRGVGSIFRLRGHQKCKPQIESRSQYLITKWKYKIEYTLSYPPPRTLKNLDMCLRDTSFW